MAIDEDGTDFSYFSPVEFGSSGKSMYMLIDTGAANTWVVGSDCTTKACASHNSFGTADSTSLQNTNSKFNLTYGTGTFSGMIVNDTVKMAGISIPLSFGSASTTSDDFSTYPMDGILGLGRSVTNVMNYPTVMDAIKNAKVFPTNILGISLERNSDKSTNGEINFGAPDAAKYTGALSFTNLVSGAQLWEIPIDDAAVNGVSCNFSGKSAIVDTGTSFMLLPPLDAASLHAQIPQSVQDGEDFNVPCSSAIPVQVTISSVTYNVSSKDYIGNPVKGGPLCSSNIIGREIFGTNRWLLGDVFLKNVYTVFDFDKDRIGTACACFHLWMKIG